MLRTEFGATHGYASLERPDVRARALADPVSFLNEHPTPAVLDEIQYAPELLPFVKERIDTDRRAGQWILSGSQSFPLMRGVGETLAGRIAVLTLDPLSVGEILQNPGPLRIDDLIAHVWNRTPTNAGSPPSSARRPRAQPGRRSIPRQSTSEPGSCAAASPSWPSIHPSIGSCGSGATCRPISSETSASSWKWVISVRSADSCP